MENPLKTDVLVIGGGIAGMAIARELSKYNVGTTVIEKEADVGMGVTKTGHGNIETGAPMAYSMILKSIMAPDAPLYDPESLSNKLLAEGSPMLVQLLADLDIPHARTGAIVIATNQEELERLKKLEELSKKIHLWKSDVRIIDRETLFRIEPNINKEVIAALYDPVCAITVFPPELVFALAENARANGVSIMTGIEAISISSENGIQAVKTNRITIHAKFVINAAGKYADKVADMAGARDDWGLTFNRSQMILLDRRLKGLINNIIHLPVEPGKFGYAAPLHEGNIYLAIGKYENVIDRNDRATTGEGFRTILEGAKRMIPAISDQDVITSFVGVRLFNTRNPENPIMEASKSNPRFINVILKMPGYIPSIPLAERVVDLLAAQGLDLTRKPFFNPYRKGIPRFSELPGEEKDRLISQDSRYGHVVCRCETVTEGEIVEAIRHGASTLQGIQFRTRAGMGRCQSAFCGPRVVKILARELGISPTEVTQKGGNSRILLFRSKELLQGSRI